MSAAAATSARIRALTPGETAWIAVLPCAVAIIAAMLVLGPPLGHALLRPGADDLLWPHEAFWLLGHAEPVKHARFAIALLGPVLLAALVLTTAGRRALRMRPRAARRLVAVSQALTLAFLLVAILGQHNLLFAVRPRLWGIFPVWTLIGALVATLLVPVASRRTPLAGWIARRARDPRGLAIACLAVAALLTACWLLMAIDSESTVGRAAFPDLPPWSMADALAVLDGRTPLVNYYPVYGSLWAYLAAVPLRLFEPTITVFTVTMTSIAAVALLALYAVYRRIVRSSLLALGLYLPTLATGFIVLPSVWAVPASNVQIFSVWPIRYAGPYLLAWLTARHLDGSAPRRAWWLFLAGGLVAVNNVEFGAGALVGTAIGLACARPLHSRRAAARMAGAIATGLLAAALLVSLLALLRTGQFPHVSYLFEFPRIFGASGWVALRMPIVGLHLALFATFTAAICVAIVRSVRDERDALLTGMLAWSGVFGLLAGSYFAGRSDEVKLAALFSAWCFSLSLLLVVVVRGLSARSWRRVALADLMVIFGFALTVPTLHETPTPWGQIARLSRTTPAPLYGQTAATRFVREHTRAHEHVAILMDMGTRIAYRLRLVDVSPYPLLIAMATRGQMRTLIAAMHSQHAHKLFVRRRMLTRAHAGALTRAGFTQRAGGSYAEWSDERTA